MNTSHTGPTPTSATLCGLSLLRHKSRIQEAYPEYTFSGPQRLVGGSAYVGWAQSSSVRKAQLLAKLFGGNALALSAGFLNRYSPDLVEPTCAYLIGDSVDPHSAIRACIASEPMGKGDADRAKSAMQALRSSKLSIYNNAQQAVSTENGFIHDQPYVLLIDQSTKELRLNEKMGNHLSILGLIERAKQSWPNYQVIIRPCEGQTECGVLEKQASTDRSVWVAPRLTNIWDMIENADHVFTHSSHAGFEALIAGKPVTCSGAPFYAGHGLTEDIGPAASPSSGTSQTATLAQIFSAAYLTCSRYVDPHSNKPSTFEDTLDTLSCIVNARNSNRTGFVTVNFSPWKRRATEAFLIGPAGMPKHVSGVSTARRMARKTGASLAIWGSAAERPNASNDGVPVKHLEDGFIRSVGLGAHFHFPSSLVLETTGFLYYDARGESTLEKIIRSQHLDQRAIQRAKALRSTIVNQGVNKYNLSQTAAELPPQTDRLKILVPGQVENDASIKFGAGEIRTNTQLLNAVRERYPHACIGYRAHPDVRSNARPGVIPSQIVSQLADFDAGSMDINALLSWSDRVETITSLTGFEALLRGVSVGTHGWPFYAGWGLSDDRWARPARGRTTLDELVYAALIAYPSYVHPISRLPCEVEKILGVFSDPLPVSVLQKWLLHPVGRTLGRLKHRWKGPR